MPDSLRDLALLGVHLTQGDGASFRGIRFVNDRDVATAQFPAGGELSSATGVGMRRKALHKRLVQRATEAGVTLRWASPVQLKDSGQVLVGGEPTSYGLLVGADGHSSRVRRWAGLEQGTELTRRFGFRQHFAVKPWSPYVEVHWGESGQAYVTPVGPNEVCVATVARDPRSRLNVILNELPELRERLAGGSAAQPRLDAERGAMTTTRRLKLVAEGRVALIGDASGSADAITGEGMGMGFRQALLLAECVEQNNLARYNREHPAILKLPQTMARVMLLMDRSRFFRKRAIAMLASEPELFRRMLGVHLGTESLPGFIAANGLAVAWRLAVGSNPVPVPATLV